jgi:hypothetical protein
MGLFVVVVASVVVDLVVVAFVVEVSGFVVVDTTIFGVDSVVYTVVAVVITSVVNTSTVEDVLSSEISGESLHIAKQKINKNKNQTEAINERTIFINLFQLLLYFHIRNNPTTGKRTDIKAINQTFL